MSLNPFVKKFEKPIIEKHIKNEKVNRHLNWHRASERHFNYFPYKLIPKDTQLKLWNSQTEPNKTEESSTITSIIQSLSATHLRRHGSDLLNPKFGNQNSALS